MGLVEQIGREKQGVSGVDLRKDHAVLQEFLEELFLNAERMFLVKGCNTNLQKV